MYYNNNVDDDAVGGDINQGSISIIWSSLDNQTSGYSLMARDRLKFESFRKQGT